MWNLNGTWTSKTALDTSQQLADRLLEDGVHPRQAMLLDKGELL
jgi:hypothetical protein